MNKQDKQHLEKQMPSELQSSFFREIQIEFLIHEMKDPVSIIETGARTLLEKKEKYGHLSSRQEKTLKRILRSVRKAQGMLNDLLEIGRSESGCFTCCLFSPAKATYDALIDALETFSGNISERVIEYRGEHQAVEFLSDYGILLKIAPHSSHIEMLQDELKFRQIVGNLIKNALYHRQDRIEIRMGAEKEYIFVEVVDDGPGIGPEHHQMIFERYTQINNLANLRRKGHGLGLAGALISARSIGGDIEVKSEKGMGATFRLTLPIAFKKMDTDKLDCRYRTKWGNRDGRD